MREAYLLCVGKLKDKNILAIESDYLKRITELDLKITEAKDKEQIPAKIKELGKTMVILLEERGKKFSSPDFAKYLDDLIAKNLKLVFVIGGADGHDSETLKLKSDSLSLSSLTFPHQLARILFVEQLYRAFSILKNHPYHK